MLVCCLFPSKEWNSSKWICLFTALWRKSLFFSRFSFKFWSDLHDLEYVHDCSALFIGWYYLIYWQHFWWNKAVSFLRKGASSWWYHFACHRFFLALSSWKYDKQLLKIKLRMQGHQISCSQDHIRTELYLYMTRLSLTKISVFLWGKKKKRDDRRNVHERNHEAVPVWVDISSAIEEKQW